jgi:hypothetical protein
MDVLWHLLYTFVEVIKHVSPNSIAATITITISTISTTSTTSSSSSSPPAPSHPTPTPSSFCICIHLLPKLLKLRLGTLEVGDSRLEIADSSSQQHRSLLFLLQGNIIERDHNPLVLRYCKLATCQSLIHIAMFTVALVVTAAAAAAVLLGHCGALALLCLVSKCKRHVKRVSHGTTIVTVMQFFCAAVWFRWIRRNARQGDTQQLQKAFLFSKWAKVSAKSTSGELFVW